MNERKRILGLIFGRTLVVLVALAVQFAAMFFLLFRLLEDLPLLFGGTVAFTAVILICILNSESDPSVKLSWCFVTAVLPLFGAIFYFFTRLDIGHRLERKMLQKTLRESAPLLKCGGVSLTDVEDEDKSLASLARYLRNTGSGQIYTNTQVKYFPVGEDMFHALCAALEQANRYIYMEYFIISQSYMWQQILQILQRKAKQGVQVRVLYDGNCTLGYLPHDYPEELARMGIQCKVFSPFRPFVSTHYNNRDHRKITVIDGVVAFTGGINLQDRYINRKRVYGHWKDTAVMLRGDGAKGFDTLFLQMWNMGEKVADYTQFPETIPAGSGTGYVIPYGVNPMGKERIGENIYLHMIANAKDYVYIMTPYLILDEQMLLALCFAARRGVDVRVVLPHIPDKKYAFALAKSHYPRLQEAGVKIYEYTPGFVHAKTFLCDDYQATVGTVNLDYRSLYLHFECGAYLYKVDALKEIRADFEKTFARSHLITDEDIENISIFYKLAGIALKVAAPLL